VQSLWGTPNKTDKEFELDTVTTAHVLAIDAILRLVVAASVERGDALYARKPLSAVTNDVNRHWQPNHLVTL
jgi:hypothetical protein